MQLILMRHGEAGHGVENDFDRPLTPSGADDVARTSGSLGGKPTHIIASPLVRARQTAGIVAGQCGIADSVSTWDELSPDGRVEIVVARLGDEPGVPLVVTHQPLIGRLIAWLTGMEIPVGTSMAVGIGWEIPGQGCGEVEWVVQS